MTAAQTVHIIGGPTASGKSALALDLAARVNGVIINADSMQVYDALPTLTAQPSAADRAAAPHLLYGTLPAAEKCTAGRWRTLAAAAIEDAFAAGKTPIVVGGTGFYLRTLTHGLSPIPEIPPAFRERAEQIAAESGAPALHAALTKTDPVIAARLAPGDTQRLIRAWEVFEFTGKPLSYWQSLPAEGPPAHWRFETQVVLPERDELYRRCDARFDAMLENGILAEVKRLVLQIAAGTVPPDAAITNALGFHPLRVFIEGRCTIEQAIEQTKLETRQYAKRQVTWFRNQMTD